MRVFRSRIFQCNLLKFLPQAPLALLACTTNSAHSRLQMVEKLYCGAAPHEGCELRVVVYRFVGLACSIKSIANINIIVDCWTIGIRQDMRLRNSRPCATTSARVWETWYSLHLPSFLPASEGIPPGQAYYPSRLHDSWFIQDRKHRVLDSVSKSRLIGHNPAQGRLN